MSKIRLLNITTGQTFFEKDGSSILQLRALEDAHAEIGGMQPGIYCNCLVTDGLAKGDTINLYEPIGAKAGSDGALDLYDRLHLDMPPLRRKPYGKVVVVPADQKQLDEFMRINGLSPNEVYPVVDFSDLKAIDIKRMVVLLPGCGMRPDAIAAIDIWKWRKGEMVKLDSSMILSPELLP